MVVIVNWKISTNSQVSRFFTLNATVKDDEKNTKNFPPRFFQNRRAGASDGTEEFVISVLMNFHKEADPGRFLGQNCIEKIENLDNNAQLWTLSLPDNFIKKIENIRNTK